MSVCDCMCMRGGRGYICGFWGSCLLACISPDSGSRSLQVVGVAEVRTAVEEVVVVVVHFALLGPLDPRSLCRGPVSTCERSGEGDVTPMVMMIAVSWGIDFTRNCFVGVERTRACVMEVIIS